MVKKYRLHIIIGAAALLLLTIVGIVVACNAAPKVKEPTVLENADAVYQEAVNYLNGRQSMGLEIEYEKITTMGGDVFRENSTQTVTYEGLGTQQLRGCSEQSLTIGSHSISICEVYNDGTGYFTVNGSNFCSSITQEDYLAGYIPAAPISLELYAQVEGTKSKEGCTIHFTKAAAAETWAAATGAQNIQAEATAHIDPAGNLTETAYTLSYEKNGTAVSLTATVTVCDGNAIELPQDPAVYTAISCPEGPRLLEVACGYLLSARDITASYKDTISCEAFGDIRNQSIDVHTHDAVTWNGSVDTVITLENSSNPGVISASTKSETFANGAYTAVIDDGEAVASPAISQSDMSSYCQDILVSTLMLPEYIAGANLTETETAWRIEFKATEVFAQMLSAEACTILYQSADVLTGISQSYKTDSISCYLTIDKHTGLPAASGFSYCGTYTISQLPYKLEYEAEQTYTYE